MLYIIMVNSLNGQHHVCFCNSQLSEVNKDIDHLMAKWIANIVLNISTFDAICGGNCFYSNTYISRPNCSIPTGIAWQTFTLQQKS